MSPQEGGNPMQRVVDSVLYGRRLETSSNNLFYYLWAPKRTGEAFDTVLLPSTVLIYQNQPTSWFFTSEEGEITKRDAITISDRAHIVEEFVKLHSHSAGQKRNATVATFIPMEKGVAGGDVDIVQLDVGGLQRLLLPTNVQNGVLQAAIHQGTDKKVVFNCVWGSNFFSVNRTSLRKRDKAKSVPTKLEHDVLDVDFPGFVSGSHKRSSQLYMRLRRVCDEIVNHVHYASPQKYWITCMTVTFTLDAGGRLYLLHCSDLKIQSPIQMEARLERVAREAGLLDRPSKNLPWPQPTQSPTAQEQLASARRLSTIPKPRFSASSDIPVSVPILEPPPRGSQSVPDKKSHAHSQDGPSTSDSVVLPRIRQEKSTSNSSVHSRRSGATDRDRGRNTQNGNGSDKGAAGGSPIGWSHCPRLGKIESKYKYTAKHTFQLSHLIA